MDGEPLTTTKLLRRTVCVAQKKAGLFLQWGVVAFLLCLPIATLFLGRLNLSGSGPVDPVALWRSFTPVERLREFFLIWFMFLGLTGLTQAVSSLATWDACTDSQTSLGNVAARLFPRLHRVLGLQLFVVLMIIILVPMSVYAIPAILLDNFSVFRGIRKSVKLLASHTGQTVLILTLALVLVISLSSRLGPVTAVQGQSLLVPAFALELKMAVFYLAAVVVGIPTTLIYYQSRELL